LIVSVFLVGGGVDTMATPDLLAPFQAELESHASARRRTARLAVALFDHEGSARTFLPSYVDALTGAGSIDVVSVLVRHGQPVAKEAFLDVDGVAVAGGPTPEYLDGLIGAADVIRSVVTRGAPYVGFSAGAMIASQHALVGGFRSAGTEVCPQEWSEDLDPITVCPGLGLVRFTVDVHTAQAGTLGRTVALVEEGAATAAVGIDEDTCLTVSGAVAQPEECRVTGTGNAWMVQPAGDAASGAIVRRLGSTAWSR
jgi:cyanophycinase